MIILKCGNSIEKNNFTEWYLHNLFIIHRNYVVESGRINYQYNIKWLKIVTYNRNTFNIIKGIAIELIRILLEF